MSHVVFQFHDNFEDHASNLSVDTLIKQEIAEISQPPYFIDLDPSYHHQFPKLKGACKRNTYSMKDEVKSEIFEFFIEKFRDFLEGRSLIRIPSKVVMVVKSTLPFKQYIKFCSSSSPS